MNICRQCKYWKVREKDLHKPAIHQYAYCSLPQWVGTMSKQHCPDFSSKERWPAQIKRAKAMREIDLIRQTLDKKKA